jgi:DNA-binding LytR/AlgR family response regulator
VNQIQQLAHWFNRGYLLILKGREKVEVPVSRAYAKKLKEYIHF